MSAAGSTSAAAAARPHHQPPHPLLASFSGISVKGVAPFNPEKCNQDALVMHQLPVNGRTHGEILLSVFDGHGENGHKVSGHFKARIPALLASSASFADAATTNAAIRDALLQAEREIVEDYSVDTSLSGTTGVVTVLRGNRLFAANVGDSRAVMGRADARFPSKVRADNITKDHKPDDPAEKSRIEEIGGRVFAVRFDDGIDGPARVWVSYADLPGLAMSRSLCDTIAKEAGVVSEPDLFELDLTAEDKFMIVATDGLWEFLSSQEVVDIVAKHASPTPDPEAAIRELVAESQRRWRLHEPVIDDTTMVVVYFRS